MDGISISAACQSANHLTFPLEGNRSASQTVSLFTVSVILLSEIIMVGSVFAAESFEKEDPALWAFENLSPKPSIPDVVRKDLIKTPVDAFLLAQLESSGILFSPMADRSTKIRRAYLDLIGLTPSLEEVDLFLADSAEDAYSRLIDRLLSSPHFGERWARHWLDVVGYVDTVGFDIGENYLLMTDGKWRYRDYVIQSFNRDKPYDRFLTEQLAGDEISDWRTADYLTTLDQELLIATGFMRTAQDFSHEPESNIPENHYAVLHDTLEIVGSSLLGLTVSCARCHDHKFDPITQQDYYRLMALLTPAYNPQDWKAVYPYRDQIVDRTLPDVGLARRKEMEGDNAEIDRKVTHQDDALQVLVKSVSGRILEKRLAALPEEIRQDVREALGTPNKDRKDIEQYLADKFQSLETFSEEDLIAERTSEEGGRMEQLRKQIQTLNKDRRNWGKIQALWDVGTPDKDHVFIRGNYQTLGPEVEPGFLEVLSDETTRTLFQQVNPTGDSSGRRLALAQWLTGENSPAASLVAAVMVNRIWQHLFGRGIVATPGNLGRNGQRPTHPKLLRWLSHTLIDGGWRIKPLIRTIMLSHAYQQQSSLSITWTAQSDNTQVSPESVDPGNELLWRQRLRRIESEVIRDCMLGISDRLDRTMGGPPVLLKARPDGMVVVSEDQLARPEDKYRRSVYLLTRRAFHLSFLAVFDQPSVATNCSQRDVSAVPLQSLTMMNDAFTMDRARDLSARVRRDSVIPMTAAIEKVFRLTLVRQPTDHEMNWCQKFLQEHQSYFQTKGMDSHTSSQMAFVQLCHTLFNTSEFLYVE